METATSTHVSASPPKLIGIAADHGGFELLGLLYYEPKTDLEGVDTLQS